MEILYLSIIFIVGVGGSYFFAKSKFSRKNIELEQKNKNFELNEQRFKEDLIRLGEKLEEKETDIISLNSDLSRKSTEYSNLDQKLKEQKEDIEKLQDKFRIEFKNLANEILEEKSKKFTEQNQNQIGEILKPLGEKITDFKKRVEETYDKESKLRFSLIEEIKRLETLNQQISKDAVNLTKALKGDSKAQGNWGELVLENVLEKSGLVKDREYFVQNSYTTETGKRLQPDVIVKYPGDRNVIIDSKVSLTAYERHISVDNDDERDAAYKAHILSLKNHISELSQKNYQDLYQLNSLDFVMMFLPVEPAYLLAIQRDPDLWNYAYDKRILLISPTNLIAALKMVESLWRQEYQSRNVQEIARQSGKLYDKFEGFVSDLIEIGKRLDSAKSAYEGSMNKLSTGKGNLVRSVEKIKKLGAKTTKELPKNLLERAEETE